MHVLGIFLVKVFKNKCLDASASQLRILCVIYWMSPTTIFLPCTSAGKIKLKNNTGTSPGYFSSLFCISCVAIDEGAEKSDGDQASTLHVTQAYFKANVKLMTTA